MIIKHFYSPKVAGEVSGESLIFKRGLGQLFDEIRQSILQSNLIISSRQTITKSGSGTTGIPGLADALNKGLASSLTSLGWGQLKAPGATGLTAKVDWFKAIPSGIGYGPTKIGLGLEAQFGNNYQFNADLQRLSEAILDQSIVAGVSIVASDELKNYKADRGAYFTSEKQKLDRFLTMLVGSGAALVPSFVLIGIGPDGFGFSDRTGGFYKFDVPIFDSELGVQAPPVRFETFTNLS
jgi:hypothetical protein